MTLFIGFLTLVLVLDSLLLILLVLIQLPKKEAGAGVAFGGGATDALFGAGSGNALTKVTKYAAAVFLGLCMILSVMNANRSKDTATRIQQQLQKQSASSPAVTTAPIAPKQDMKGLPTVAPFSNVLNSAIPASTNATAVEATATVTNTVPGKK
jgi:protein translocase SecG subunit